MSTPETIELKDEKGNPLTFKRTAESKSDGKTLCTYTSADGKLKADVAFDDDALQDAEPDTIARLVARAIADDVIARAENAKRERPDSHP